ncbi:172_t:CDS:2 [Paraglomus brasilianum]|uniref:172_t:CDS:1 n=1 Tax=Paraglomus brasilianum TaxID=144538 RepID=A0A9N8ZR56_9GLOM|nr:172_t:CDS:2 [Paraglomus brasilianum]
MAQTKKSAGNAKPSQIKPRQPKGLDFSGNHHVMKIRRLRSVQVPRKQKKVCNKCLRTEKKIEVIDNKLKSIDKLINTETVQQKEANNKFSDWSTDKLVDFSGHVAALCARSSES